MSSRDVPELDMHPAEPEIFEDPTTKDDKSAHEVVQDPVLVEDQGILKSRFDELSLPKTVWIFRKVVWWSFVLCTMNMLDGWQINIAGTIVVNRGFIKQFGDQDGDGVYNLNTTWLSAWAAIINVGQMTSMLYIPYVANRFGRKASYYLCWVAFILCLICLTTAKHPGVWLVGKWFLGIAAGSVQMTTGPYLIEIAPNRIRGGLSTFPGIWSGICSVICSLMLQISNKRYPDNYLLPIYVCWGVSGIMIAAIISLPESPWVYGRRNEKQKAFKAMKRLYGNVPGYNYEEEWMIIVRTLEQEKKLLAEQSANQLTDLFVGQNKRRTFLVVGLYFAQIWGGLSMIGTFGTYFFAIAGLDDPFLANLITSCIGLLNTLVYSLIVDKVGRRPLTMYSYTMCSLMLFLMGGLYYVNTKSAGIALLVLTCIWNCGSGIVSGMYGILSSELPSAHLRVKTVTTSLFSAAAWAIVTCFAVPPLLKNMNLRGCFVFGATSFPCAVAMWFFLPETKSRAAAEIDELFERRIPAWRWNNTRTYIEEQTHAVIVADRDLAAKNAAAQQAA